MVRFNLSSLVDFLADSLRYIVLVLVLLWLIVMAASIGI